MEITFRPIGYVENEFDEPAPGDKIRQRESRIIVDEGLSEGLDGIEGFEKLLVVFYFHRAPKGYALRQHPRGDASRPKRGVFALRSPHRPNPIGVTVVDLVAVEGNVLVVRGLDALNGTPILDIKPFANYSGCHCEPPQAAKQSPNYSKEIASPSARNDQKTRFRPSVPLSEQRPE